MSVIKKVTKKIQVTLVTVFSIPFSLSCHSDPKPQRAMHEENKIEYQCGKKCFAIDRAIFELRVGKEFINDDALWSAKMLPFEKRFKKELLRLKTTHKIDISASNTMSGNYEPNFHAVEGLLKVYVTMTQDKCDYSKINFEVVSLSSNDIGFQKLICKKGDNQCIDDTLSRVFEEHVLENIRDHDSSGVQ